MSDKIHKKYWKINLSYLAILLSAWFLCSYGAGIIWKENLDSFKIGGFKLGFWFAQQGSIYCFCIIIFIYIGLMNTLDKKFEVDERPIPTPQDTKEND